MKILHITLLLGLLLFITNINAQYNPRLENENYMVTKFYDSFSSSQLDRSVWTPSAHEIRKDKYDIDLFIWVDSSATVNQSYGSLHLSMLHYPNYTTTNWDDDPITADFIAGQVESKEHFTYGVYECSATFANKKGSFPAFWSMSSEDCDIGMPNNEMDFVELKYEHSNPTIDNGIFYYPPPCFSGHEGHGSSETTFTWGGTHTFKCVWKPSKIEFWVDNIKLNTVQNTGQYWYPEYDQRLILSQQITIYIPDKNNPPIYGIITPQTSNFHWVKVREFFLAPEITCPNVICSSDTAIMDVDPDATNITWQLSPTNLFSDTTGTGKTASISVNPSASGRGKITYSFDMPSGNTFESFEAEKAFWVGDPLPSDISLVVMGNLTGQQVNQYMMCPNTGYILICQNSNNQCLTSNYSWFLHYRMSVISTSGNTAYINTNSSPGGILTVKAQTCCSANATIMSEVLDTDGYDCDGWYMSFSPNPTTGETTLTIESESKEKAFDEGIVWEYEVYNAGQRLKTKQTKIRGSSTTIQTQSWKEGNYVVHIKFSPDGKTEKILTGKLMVKK